MTKDKIISIIVVVLFLTVLFNSSINYVHNNVSERPENYQSQEIEIPSDKSKDTNSGPTGTRGTRTASLTENNQHGGSWVDSFVDDSGINEAKSDNLNLNNNEVKIKKKIPKPFTLDNGTIGLWHLDEGSGSTVYDETTNSHDGTINGSTWTKGKFDDALRFDGGGSQRVEVPHHNSLNFTNVFTLEAWVFREKNSNRDMIVCKEHAYYLQIDYFNKLSLNIYSGSNNIYRSTSTIPLGRWVHVAASADGSNVRLYINGCLDAKYTQTKSCMTNTKILEIGRLYYQPLKWFHKGRIDEVRISNISRKYFDCMANLTSKPITIPANREWDSLIINKTQPPNTAMNIKILNATDNQQISGTPVFTEEGEFDISNIDPKKYPSIKLYAAFRCKGLSTLILHYWGVSWRNSNSWRDTLFGGLKSTNRNLTRGDGDCWLNTKPTNFTKCQNNPVIKKGTASTWDVNGVSSPSVLYNGTKYMMWFRGMTSSKWEIGLATSNDGISWTKHSGSPVLKCGPSSSWDDSYIGAPSVMYDGNIYKMWYQGERTKFKIGYATSTDGISWKKYANNPVVDLGTSGSWEDNFVCGPFVYFDGVEYHMWYGGKNGATQIYKVGYASSYDGINWTKYPNNPILAAPSGSMGGLCTLPERDYFLGWYNLGSTGFINMATSRDGLFWVNYTNNPVLRTSSAAWEDTRIQNPDVITKDNQFWMYYTARGSNIQIGLARSNFSKNANLTSEVITLPQKSEYDQLIINKNEPSGTFINVSILDATTKKAIKNYENIRSEAIDISGIFRDIHPAVILKASITSPGFSNLIPPGINTPVLSDWSLSWTDNSRPKILDINSPRKVNRTHSVCITINLSDVEELEQNLKLQIRYRAPDEFEWNNSYLTTPNYNIDHWECIFTPPIDAQLGLYEFEFKCNDSCHDFDIRQDFEFIKVVNNDPIIWNISTKPVDAHVNRTKNIRIFVNCTDIETPKNLLSMKIKYKSPEDQYENYIYDKEYSNGLWLIDFAPRSFADLGMYIFNITCNDSDSEVYDLFNVQVVNNLPIPPEVSIFPINPITLDELEVEVKDAFDIETRMSKLKYWYRWYKNNFYMPEFENETTIPSLETMKDQTWRCVVYVYDGDDLGEARFNETVILNSPPILVEDFDYYEMDEDTTAVLENKLTTIFTDYDNDILAFLVTGNENITVELSQRNGTITFSPLANWFGTEAITLYANDWSPVQAQETVMVNVRAVNDLPVITQVGEKPTNWGYPEIEFSVNQDDWLNLSIQVEDIDGDVERGLISYFTNISESVDFYFNENQNEIIFHPHNDDVGWHYVNISITDNNETPLEFVLQYIRIRVVNVNDPPTVKILSPENNHEFFDTDKINFTAIADDIDLLVWNSDEELMIRWRTVYSIFGDLGTGERLENITLAPGTYNITVEVSDSANTKVYAYVNIIVKPHPEDKPRDWLTNYQYLVWLIIIIIIITIIGILLFVITRKKKRERALQAAPEGLVLQPDASYLPGTQLPSARDIVRSPQLSQPQLIQSEPLATAPTLELLGAPTTVPGTTQPPAQLPPVHVGTSAYAQESIATIQVGLAGAETEWTPQQKLNLLDERLVRGEIDQEIYLDLKAKFELEAQPYQPVPQLPPAAIPTDSTPTVAQVQVQPLPDTTPPAVEVPPDTIEPPTGVPPATIIPPEVIEPTPMGELFGGAYQPPTVQQPPQPQIQPQSTPQPTTQPQVQSQPQLKPKKPQ